MVIEFSQYNTLSLPIWASLGAQMVMSPLAMQETGVRSLGREDPLGMETAMLSCVLA